MNQDEAKRRAARAALAYLPEAGVVGLGSGSTAKFFIEGVGELVQSGRALLGVATSQQSRSLAQRLGIPLADDPGPWEIDVTVDGADEVSDALDVIKGGGGCQTREKIVNDSSRKNIIVVDPSKLSDRLGEKWPIPVEVLKFGHQATAKKLAQYGRVTLRTHDGAAWFTDAGNYIYDVNTGRMEAPAEVDARLRAIPGVVETGLFVGRADTVIVVDEKGIRELNR
jgi:ribose 5-phosphate isomerase A